MSIITRAWLAFAAIGAGLIHVALTIGMPLTVAVPLAAIGAAEFAWGVIVFARTTVPVPRTALVVALLPIIAWVVLLIASAVPEGLGLLPLAIASVFGLFVVAVLGRHLRRDPDAVAPAPGLARYLISVIVGGLLVGGLAAPALAATTAARSGPSPATVSNLRDLFGHLH